MCNNKDNVYNNDEIVSNNSTKESKANNLEFNSIDFDAFKISEQN